MQVVLRQMNAVPGVFGSLACDGDGRLLAQAFPPSYEQKHFSEEDRRGGWRLVASPDAAGGSLKIHQDARVYAALVDGTVDHAIAPGRRAWLQVARGKLKVGELELREGDGLAVENAPSLKVSGSGEALLFDLP